MDSGRFLPYRAVYTYRKPRFFVVASIPSPFLLASRLALQHHYTPFHPSSRTITIHQPPTASIQQRHTHKRPTLGALAQGHAQRHTRYRARRHDTAHPPPQQRSHPPTPPPASTVSHLNGQPVGTLLHSLAAISLFRLDPVPPRGSPLIYSDSTPDNRASDTFLLLRINTIVAHLQILGLFFSLS